MDSRYHFTEILMVGWGWRERERCKERERDTKRERYKERERERERERAPELEKWQLIIKFFVVCPNTKILTSFINTIFSNSIS